VKNLFKFYIVQLMCIKGIQGNTPFLKHIKSQHNCFQTATKWLATLLREQKVFVTTQDKSANSA
jgi:hypothetical protein